jgi:DNA adenine methylase
MGQGAGRMNSPLPYIGGKSKLAQTIIGLIPNHLSYCEAFSGAAWVLFRKEPSKYEIINDLDSDLIAFYRVVQNHLEEFLKQFKWLLCSREWFEDWKRQREAGGLTDIQRAARYYYLQRMCFGGRVRSRSFGLAPESSSRINLLRIEEELSLVHLRLSQVTIENLPWERFVAAYDRPKTFFYLDPPYYKAPDYDHNLEPADYPRLAETLSGIKGKFLLSINDHPEMRKAYDRFNIKPVTLTYTVSKQSATKGMELIVTNY